jgi:hypothetical protein
MTMKFDTWCKQCTNRNDVTNITCGSCEFNDANMPSRFLAKATSDSYTYREPLKLDGTTQGEYERLALEIGKLVDTKQKAYGDSFSKAEDFLRILYPNGIRKHQYKDLLTIVRIFDKLMRIATDKDALGESPYQDLAGYSLLGLMADRRSPDPTATKENYLKEKSDE